MPVELIGVLSTQDRSAVGGDRPRAQPDAVRRLAHAHEDAGFDRVLVPTGPSVPDSHQVAAYAALQTERLGLLIAHQPGLTQPTVAARALATLDRFSDGRVAVLALVGASEHERRRDGDFLPEQDALARDREYLQLLKQAWAAREPVDVDGRFYRVQHYVNHISPLRHHIPLYIGGSGADVAQLAEQEADVHLLPAPPRHAGAGSADTHPAVEHGHGATGVTEGHRHTATGVTVTVTPDTNVQTLLDHVDAGASALVLDGYELDQRIRDLITWVREHAGAGAGERVTDGAGA